MGRRSIWSNSRVIELAKEFVPATDEVWRLQNGNDPECKHFQKISEVGHYRDHGTTRQGIYVCTPSARLLGSMNTHNVDAVIKMMEEGLAQYRAMPIDERKLASTDEFQPAHRWEDSHSQVGLDVTMYARDLPESCDPNDEVCAAWNQDRVWFSKDEARQFLPSDRHAITPGTGHEVPMELVSRFAQFSVIDTVKGQTSHYDRDEVGQSQMWVTIDEVMGATVSLTIRGQTHAESAESRGREMPHGIKTELLGRAKFDLASETFQEFEMVALGTRWGRTVFNGRRRELDESAVGFVFQMTPDGAPVIAPAYLFAYRAPWVKRP